MQLKLGFSISTNRSLDSDFYTGQAHGFPDTTESITSPHSSVNVKSQFKDDRYLQNKIRSQVNYVST